MLERTLVQKQNLLNHRRAQIKLAIKDICDIIGAANERNKTLTENQTEYLRWCIVQFDKILTYDFSITENYNNVVYWLRGVQANVLKW